MAIFSSADVERIILRGEEDISVEVPFLVDRFSPAIVAGTQAYAMPSDMHSIRRVTWLGEKLFPQDHRNFRSYVNTGQAGKPYTYIFNNIGQLEIVFYYVPNMNIAAGSVDLWLDDIPTAVIIEYYRVANGTTFILPDYWRRRLLKIYLKRQTYKMEGPGQKKSFAVYYEKRWTVAVAEFNSHVNDMINKSRKLTIQGSIFLGQQVYGTLRLPSNFGIGVDDPWL